MALKTFRPTTPGLRQLVLVDRRSLWKGAPVKMLTDGKTKSGGRNNYGHITTRHIGGGHKQAYRRVDFRRTKHDMPARVERLEYDPNRTAFIALLKYQDGTLSYYCELFDGGTPRFNLTENDNGTYSAVDTVLLPEPLPAARFRLIAGGSALADYAWCEAVYADVPYFVEGEVPITAHGDTHVYVQNLTIVLDYAIQIDEVTTP